MTIFKSHSASTKCTRRYQELRYILKIAVLILTLICDAKKPSPMKKNKKTKMDVRAFYILIFIHHSGHPRARDLAVIARVRNSGVL